MKLKNRLAKIPTGFNYLDHDTKSVISSLSFLGLLRGVNQHRHSRGLTLHPNQDQMIEDQLCDKLPKEFCDGYGLGDIVHAVAQPIAKSIDRVVGTNIQGCGACASRRAILNS